MNDIHSKEQAKCLEQDKLVRELARDVAEDVQRMRATSAELEAVDWVAWRRVQNAAHNIAARAGALKLVVLQQCARELEELAACVQTLNESGKARHLESAMVAIETIALEVETLT